MVNRLKETMRKPKGRREYREECKHHWLLETPNGPTARGVCKYCGENKDFYNTWPVT
jgi:hypothetical protein